MWQASSYVTERTRHRYTCYTRWSFGITECSHFVYRSKSKCNSRHLSPYGRLAVELWLESFLRDWLKPLTSSFHIENLIVMTDLKLDFPIKKKMAQLDLDKSTTRLPNDVRLFDGDKFVKSDFIVFVFHPIWGFDIGLLLRDVFPVCTEYSAARLLLWMQ